jgi:hypothetical protein
MKKVLLLITFITAIALCASAQTLIDFTGMPVATTPTPMPTNYPSSANIYWDNFLYVTPGLWSGAGPGFWVDPATKHNTTLFIGGPWQSIAQGSIELQLKNPGPNISTFTPVSMLLAAGWNPNSVLVAAYCNSKLVGTTVWNLTTTPQTFTFPSVWTNVTQLVFTADPNMTSAVHPTPGSMVIYSFVLIAH